MSRAIKWERLRSLRTPLLMVLAFAMIAVGTFKIYEPAGWIVIGLSLIFIAFVTDDEEPSPR